MSVKNIKPENFKRWKKAVLCVIKSLKGEYRNLPKTLNSKNAVFCCRLNLCALSPVPHSKSFGSSASLHESHFSSLVVVERQFSIFLDQTIVKCICWGRHFGIICKPTLFMTLYKNGVAVNYSA